MSLLQVQARDQDCSIEFGSICRYELLAEPHNWSLQQQQLLEANPDLMSAFTVDSSGRVKMKRSFLAKAAEAGAGNFSNKVWKWHNNPDSTSNSNSDLVSDQPQPTRGNSTSRSLPTPQANFSFAFQVIAYDCGGKKSLAPATIHLHLNKLCRPKLKGKLQLSSTLVSDS